MAKRNRHQAARPVNPFFHSVTFYFTFLISSALTANAAPPEITAHPRSQGATNGATVRFTVAASSSLPLTFQWKHEGVELFGQTQTNLVLTNVSSTDSGNYAVTVRNSEASSTSSNATLRVVP